MFLNLLLQASNAPSVWYNDPITLATVVIAVAAAINLIVSIYMGKKMKEYTEVTRNIFEASNRPYISIYGPSPTVNIQEKRMQIKYSIKNYGSIPTNELKASCNILVNGTSLRIIEPEDGAHVISPQDPVNISMSVNNPKDFDAIRNGPKAEFVATVKYKGITDKEYRFEQRTVYDPNSNRFYLAETKNI